MKAVWPWLAAASSGALLALCFAPWKITPLVWVALAPLICAIWFSREPAKRPGLRAALLGYVAGLVFFTAVFYWLGALAPLFEQPWLYALPLLLALIFGFYFAFWAWFLARVVAPDPEQRMFRNSWSNLATGALAATAWITHEWVRGWLFSGFGWNNLGVALHADLPMIQIADLTGVAGLSWLVAFVNVMIVIITRRIIGELGPQFVKRIRWEFSISVAVVVCVFTYGVRSLLAKTPETVPLRVTAHGETEQTYHKMHLVPFGEYLPLRPLFAPIVGELVSGDFAHGTEPLVFNLPSPALKIGALICFEDTLGDLTRRFVQSGAQLLVNITNDGWFLRTAGAEQHLSNAILRAVENRRPLVRCTNTGVTCSIDRNGRVDQWLRPFQQGFAARIVNVPANSPLTFYTRHGEWLAQLGAVITVFTMLRRRFAKK